jgi:hypothetical protein
MEVFQSAHQCRHVRASVLKAQAKKQNSRFASVREKENGPAAAGAGAGAGAAEAAGAAAGAGAGGGQAPAPAPRKSRWLLW